MPLRQKLTAQALLLWRFLGFFQPPTLRLLHAVAAVLVILQFCTKLFGFGYGHVVLGLILCWVGFALVVWSLKTRGLRHYFPYLWGDMDQLKKIWPNCAGASASSPPGPRAWLPWCRPGPGRAEHEPALRPLDVCGLDQRQPRPWGRRRARHLCLAAAGLCAGPRRHGFGPLLFLEKKYGPEVTDRRLKIFFSQSSGAYPGCEAI